ncbi:MAG TPA: response regulator transcription factor, partial [Opitutaceae bacterium]|nr:response regulator transcription factor [Opitutaceae bacterium]
HPVPAAAQPMSSLFLNDSVKPIGIMGLKEARELSQFVPVIVLMSFTLANSGGDPMHAAGHDSRLETAGTSQLLELLGRTSNQSKTAEPDLVFGDVAVSFWSMEASRNGQPVKLTAMEFKTLKYFSENMRRVISRDELLNKVWGYKSYPITRTVDNHILRLRQKFERDPSRPIHFRTVHGVGYKFLP